MGSEPAVHHFPRIIRRLAVRVQRALSPTKIQDADAEVERDTTGATGARPSTG